MWRLAIIVLLASLVAACTTTVRSQISVFHALDTGGSGTTYALVPFKEQEGSLEYKTYGQTVKQELSAKGFKEVPLEQARVLVFISYGTDTGKQVVKSYPIIGQTGGSFYAPTYGVVGSGVESRTEYTRFLKLDIFENTTAADQKINKLYEAEVISIGKGGQIAAVLPTMIKALFEDFPGKSGSNRTVDRSIN